MAKLQKVTFEAREENLHFFCPLCGTHSCDESGEITHCSHLVLVHLNISDPPIMYARADIKEAVDDCWGWDEVEEQLKSLDPDGNFLILEECTSGPAMGEFQIVFSHFDD